MSRKGCIQHECGHTASDMLIVSAGTASARPVLITMCWKVVAPMGQSTSACNSGEEARLTSLFMPRAMHALSADLVPNKSPQLPNCYICANLQCSLNVAANVETTGTALSLTCRDYWGGVACEPQDCKRKAGRGRGGQTSRSEAEAWW
jgi:hypothetical protein